MPEDARPVGVSLLEERVAFFREAGGSAAVLASAVRDLGTVSGVTPDALLASGRGLLDSVFAAVGMSFHEVTSGAGSGGLYEVGLYSGRGWTVTLHVRRALGSIEYERDGHVVPYERLASHLGLREHFLTCDGLAFG